MGFYYEVKTTSLVVFIEGGWERGLAWAIRGKGEVVSGLILSPRWQKYKVYTSFNRQIVGGNLISYKNFFFSGASTDVIKKKNGATMCINARRSRIPMVLSRVGGLTRAQRRT